MAKRSFNPSVTVAAIVERDGRYLLIEENVLGRRVLNQPAGHWEKGETLTQACVRETYRDRLSAADLADPAFADECRAAREALLRVLELEDLA